METKTKVQVKDLRAGDDLRGTIVKNDPVFVGNYCGQKDRMLIDVTYSSGMTSTRVWGKNTTVTVINR
jgi:hypothetical protein